MKLGYLKKQVCASSMYTGIILTELTSANIPYYG
jgi:hypothetical protein